MIVGVQSYFDLMMTCFIYSFLMLNVGLYSILMHMKKNYYFDDIAAKKQLDTSHHYSE